MECQQTHKVIFRPPKLQGWASPSSQDIKKKRKENDTIILLPCVWWVHVGSGRTKIPPVCTYRKGQNSPTSYHESSKNTLAWVVPEPHFAFRVKYCLDYNIKLGLTRPTLSRLLKEWKIAQLNIFLSLQSPRVIICRDHCAGLDTDYLRSADSFFSSV